MKLLLYYFESLHGLKINYHKSEVMVLGVLDEERATTANVLNCREEVLPMKYLGILVSKTNLYSADLIYIGVKVEKRLPAWQRRYLSSGGKSILIESSLSSLLVYTMGIYLLPEEVHHMIDFARAYFYWNSRLKKRCHMVNWEELAKPRDHGGLGFTDIRLMNVCLLSKWMVKLESRDEDLCCTLLRKKYLKDRCFISAVLEGCHNSGKAGQVFLLERDEIHSGGWEKDQVLAWGVAGDCPIRIKYGKIIQL
jgi:hypothetical protein